MKTARVHHAARRHRRDIVIEFRWADGRYERLPVLFNELVRRNVDVIVTHGTPGILAAKQATATIPIVMATSGDAVLHTNDHALAVDVTYLERPPTE